MTNSYRIRTQVGVDKSLKVALEQDFESLEILSLKILQSQIYNRQCSDYGVVVGRVTANNGFGLPNVKVSIFIPLTDTDELNPVISELYPYKTLNDLNEDGYRYNLLPYEQSHDGHTPTGTFFSRKDVLVEPNLIEVFDKYYKYTAKTNESGDFMIFGVPVGEQTIHIDVDLSDIGEFSLAPQDLIRLNLANPSQLAGSKFKSSTNLGELPQIKQANRTIEVEPLWGQPELCYLGITRVDFDLSQEFGIKIEPAAVFMGSILSNEEKGIVKTNCKVKKKTGNFCSLVTGAGEILAIRQTINIDNNGRPILELFSLENGGKCIDENGTWMTDVPMNLDFVYTSESGERLISNDPNVGIPTKAKYRFKVKWEQPPTLTGKIIRGAFLVPNIKEWGWQNDYKKDPTVQQQGFSGAKFKTPCQPPDDNFITTNSDYLMAKASYAFSVDWDDYGRGTYAYEMIQDAINCKDRFFEMKHSKVYTVSQLVTEHRSNGGLGSLYNYIGIKDILNENCESTYNTFPANDGQKNNDFLYQLFTFILGILVPILVAVVIIKHVLVLIVCALAQIVGLLKKFVCGVRNTACTLSDIPLVGFAFKPLCWLLDILCSPLEDLYNKLNDRCTNSSLNLPMYVYDECEFCDCGTIGGKEDEIDPEDIGTSGIVDANQATGVSALLSNFFDNGLWECGGDNSIYYSQLVSGGQYDPNNPNLTTHAPQVIQISDNPITTMFTTSLTYPERLNLFNTKAKYFNSNISGGNPGGGWNRIKVSFNTDINPSGDTWHSDNVIVLMVKDTSSLDFTPGNIFSTVRKKYSQDHNLDLTGLTGFTQFGNKATTGTTYGNPVLDSAGEISYYQIDNQEVRWANWNGIGHTSTYYTITGTSQDYMKFPSDTEYFQVIKSTTVADFLANSINTSDNSGLRDRILTSDMRGEYFVANGGQVDVYSSDVRINTQISCLTNFDQQKLIFLVRGVDPYSTRTTCAYDLRRLYGYPADFTDWASNSEHLVVGNFKLNIPIQGSLRNVRHNIGSNDGLDSYTFNNQNLFFPSYNFLPDPVMYSAYTTSATTLYSKYDATDVGLYGSSPLLITGDINGLRISDSNWFAKEFYVNATSSNPVVPNCLSSFPIPPFNNPQDSFNFPGTGRNRGYFYREIIEGSGAMLLEASALQPTYSILTGWICNTGTITSYYIAERYSPTTTINMSDNARIVMRADRLPTSSNPQDNGNLSYPLATNQLFTMYSVSDEGYVDSNINDTTIPTENQENIANNPTISGASDTFGCNGLIPLRCYKYDENTGMVVIAPEGDECYTNAQGEKIVENGCYKLVTRPIISLFLDLYLLTEWAARVKLGIAACRNIYGHIFTNNWINGTLYMYPLSNITLYTGTNSVPQSQPYICVCPQLVFPDYETNVVYYRSSPYKYPDGFIGKVNGWVPNSGSLFSPANIKNLQNPTTIMDLGPRTNYVYQLVLNDEYIGYVMNRMGVTSYQDISDLLNQFLLSRLISQSVLGMITSQFAGMVPSSGNGNPGAVTDPVLRMFSRAHNKVDGDYAQMVAINSQIGVLGYDADEYLYPDTNAVPSAPQGYVFLNPSSSFYNVFGVFYKSNTQFRDWLAPHRLVISENGQVSSNICTYDNSPIFTQEVPFYQWDIRENGGFEVGETPNPDSIFGDQKNEWSTDATVFFSSGYQSMDRLNSDYMQPVDGSIYTYHKGYIYNVVNGEISAQPPQAGGPDRIVTPSGPYYFYFGLLRGKSAYDRFLVKWIKTDAFEF